MAGRTLAIGDVHGCDRALETLLDTIAVSATDSIIFLGDLVDRGPESKQVISRVLSLQDECHVVGIMGNHEEMMQIAISGRGLFNAWLDVGGEETLDSYGGSVDNIPGDHIRFLASAYSFYETETDIFVHACLESDISLRNQTFEYLRWKHLTGSERPHISGKRVICGHTSQADGMPLVFDGWVCIDTFAHGGKWLTCLDVATNQVYQASQNGDIREFALTRCT